MLTVVAPAKLNLTLEVLSKRRDGFHEIRSVIQTIDLCDSLHLQLNCDIELKCDMTGWVPEKSLVSKAARLLQEYSGCIEGAKIEVNKRIPLVSGLGGDSSDAAAALRGLNRLWGLGLSLEELQGLAMQLGSDVSFFLYGGTAMIEGRGEVVTPLPPVPHMWIVMVMPSVPRLPGKTRQLYNSLGIDHYTDGGITTRLVDIIRKGGSFNTALLFNTFENVVFTRFPEISVSQRHMVEAGATNVHLAGSGPALYTFLKDRDKADGLYSRLQYQGVETYLVETLAAIEKMD